MSDHPNAHTVRRLFESLASHDRETLAATFADDVVWHAPGTGRFSGRFEGRAAAVDRLAELSEAGFRISHDVHDVVANDEHAVALVHLHVENAEGRRYDQPQVQVMHLRDGLIVEHWTMNEDQAVLDVLMGREQGR